MTHAEPDKTPPSEETAVGKNWRQVAPTGNPANHPAKKSKGYCTKLRGPHDFSYVKEESWSYRIGHLRKEYRIYRCRACGKKNIVLHRKGA